MDALVASIFTPEGRLEGMVTQPELKTYFRDGKVTIGKFQTEKGKRISLFVLTPLAIARLDAGHALFDL